MGFYDEKREVKKSIDSFAQLLSYVQDGKKTKRTDDEDRIILVDVDGTEEKYSRSFRVAEHDRAWLEADIRELLLRRPARTAPLVEQQSYREESNLMMEKIRAFAHCVPLKLEIRIDGYCDGCFERRYITVEDGDPFVNCPDCKPTPFG